MEPAESLPRHEAPEKALNPLIALGDLAVLVIIEALVPESYGPVRFFALALLAVHAHFQGERIGVSVAALGVVALIVPSAIESDERGLRASGLLSTRRPSRWRR